MYSALQVGTNANLHNCYLTHCLGLSITIARTFQTPDRSRWRMYNQGKCTGYICLSESIGTSEENGELRCKYLRYQVELGYTLPTKYIAYR